MTEEKIKEIEQKLEFLQAQILNLFMMILTKADRNELAR